MIPPHLWQASILTTARGEEAVSDLLERVFGQSPSVYSDADTGTVLVSAYSDTLPHPLPILRSLLSAVISTARESLPGLGEARVTIKRLRRQNWAESWRRHFKPIEIGNKLLIKPSWSKQPTRDGQKSIILDPGLSFGTGHHPTTLFCLRQLVRLRHRDVKQSFLDIGCGSGILAIAATKLGYKPVAAFDNDPEAIRTGRTNIKRNKAKVGLRLADLTTLPESRGHRYDLICANLIGDLLLKEAGKMTKMLNPGGSLVVAGVLVREFPKIEQKLQRFNLALKKSWANKEWKSGVFIPA